jgi:Enoyl-(Acyl carrier protein) reductase
MHEQLVASHPLGRIAEPEEVADSIVWLATSKSSYVTGVAAGRRRLPRALTRTRMNHQGFKETTSHDTSGNRKCINGHHRW